MRSRQEGSATAPTHSMEPVDTVRERRWRRFHAASGLAFFTFASLHVLNQWLGPAGPEDSARGGSPRRRSPARDHGNPSIQFSSHRKENCMSKYVVLVWTLLVVTLPSLAPAGPVVFEASGESSADIQGAIDGFRDLLGALNPNTPGSFPSGRREINWDGVPDAFAAPNNLPPNFFNANSPRGVVFFTPGTGFQVSADSDNPTNTQIRFGNLHPLFPALFSVFSPQRLF